MDNPDFKRLVICYPKASRELVKYYPKHEKISYLECDHDALIDVLKKKRIFRGCKFRGHDKSNPRRSDKMWLQNNLERP